MLSVSLSAAAQQPETAGATNETPGANTAAPELDQAARLLFEAGSQAYEAGRFGEALLRYQNAYQLSQRPQLLYNIAVCHDRLEQRSDAADAYEMFLDALPDSPSAAIASARLEILRGALAREHARQQTQDTHAADTSTDDTSTDDTSANDTSANDTSSTVPVAEPPQHSRALAGPIIAFGIAGAGLVTLAVAGLHARGRYNDCADGHCTLAQLDTVDRSAAVADVGLTVALAGAAVGVIWLLVGGRHHDAERAQLTPAVGPDGAALVLQRRF